MKVDCDADRISRQAITKRTLRVSQPVATLSDRTLLPSFLITSVGKAYEVSHGRSFHRAIVLVDEGLLYRMQIFAIGDPSM